MLEKGNIRLRAVEPEDAELMWDVESDSSQWILNGMSAPLSRQNILDYALSYDADPMSARQIRLIIENKTDKEVVGIADIYDISPSHRHAFVGIYILPSKRRQGLAVKSLGILEDYAFRLLNINHLAARIMAGNGASIILFQKAGYTRRGEIPSWFLCGNEFIPLLLYSKILGAD